MANVRNIPLFLLFMLLLPALFSCGETAPTKEVRYLDSLNRQAYDFRYKNLDSSYAAASEAYRKARMYSQGKAEACNNLAFCAFMRMDFDGAERLYREVENITPNELERFIADIGLMRVYQRTSMNKEYYDARNSALRRMKRISEDSSVFVDSHELLRLNFAFSEFHLVSATYYYYLQQRPEALASVARIKVDTALESDTAQLLYYYYVKGAAGLVKTDNLQDYKVQQFDNLFYCWRRSLEGNYLYFEGNALQCISELLNNVRVSDLLYERRQRALQILNTEQVPDSVLPLDLAVRALHIFEKYEDTYQIAGAYRSIGTYYNRHGRFGEALSALSKALGYVNRHHELYYHCLDTADRLKPFIANDTIFKELLWLKQDDIKTVPEWVAGIREQLSVAYAGLGKKIQSDYNRNIYLDILEHTRQDKELESRYLALEEESRQLTVLMVIVITGIVFSVVLFVFLNSRWKVRNRRYIERLRLTLDVCRKITASIPSDVSDTGEIIDAVKIVIAGDMELLFGTKQVDIRLQDERREKKEETEVDSRAVYSEYALWIPDNPVPVGVLGLYTSSRLTKDDEALVKVITPYIAWTIDNGLKLIGLGDARRQLEKKRYIYEQHIAENKRQNLVKKSCLAIVAGIRPYMDRAINEIEKIKKLSAENGEREPDSGSHLIRDKFRYLDELVTKINEYNDILALWIKMKQGSLSLNIENFELNELFEVIAKGRRTFDMKHQQFEVEPTDAIVKADKALTLFMINTLTENARKYTPEGGVVRVHAREENEYVEISVEDTGLGLSDEDISRILSEKVYDSRQIGMDHEQNREELEKNKGSGFGLMNCKGIIEKYRKTSAIFSVCRFSIESNPGKGSRFLFRLPKGVRKLLLVVLLLPGMPLWAAPVSPVPVNKNTGYERLLNEASLFADSAYYSNVDENYSKALQYVDSAMNRLNRHYELLSEQPEHFLEINGDGIPEETTWWNSGFESDYYIILDIRNEAAVAFLALKDMEGYTYNNRGYTSLFKLVGEDNSLESFCRDLQHSSNNKTVGLMICVVLLLVLLAGYYVLYFRRRLMNRLNLEQILEINKQLFAVSDTYARETYDPLFIPSRIVHETFDAVNELLTIDLLGIGVFDEETRRLNLVFTPSQPAEEERLVPIMQECFDKRISRITTDAAEQCLPLLVNAGGESRCVGVLAILKRPGGDQESNRLLFELIARYVAIVVFNAVVRLADKYRDLETAGDEVRRVSREDGLIHVQNMVLDNCLSTIKHETIYYPSKIKQLIAKSYTEDADRIPVLADTIFELIAYYRDIYTILSSCASRQLEEVVFRRGAIAADELADYSLKYLKKVLKRSPRNVQILINPSGLYVVGDRIQLNFLMENLIDEALFYPADGLLKLEIVPSGEFVRFNFTDTRREVPADDLNQLFYPDLSRLSVDEGGHLNGTGYLLCKQIIRDHDEFAGRRGCRINAEPSGQGGYTVYFTLPACEKRMESE